MLRFTSLQIGKSFPQLVSKIHEGEFNAVKTKRRLNLARSSGNLGGGSGTILVNKDVVKTSSLAFFCFLTFDVPEPAGFW